MNKDLEELKFPIGKYQKPTIFSKSVLESYIQTIESFPENLRKEVMHLSDPQLDTRYRENGWTIRQVVHHCADSHINSFMRFKLALTEDRPTIKPYFEDRWAELSDSKKFEIAPSLLILEGLHKRWVILLRSLSEEDLKKEFVHPEHQTVFSLAENMGIYDWHCRHHLAHIRQLKKVKNWDDSPENKGVKKQ